MDGRETEAGSHELLQPVHVARLHRRHPLVFELRQLRPIRRVAHRLGGYSIVVPHEEQLPCSEPANDATTSPRHTGHAAGNPVARPSHTRDITSSSVGP